LCRQTLVEFALLLDKKFVARIFLLQPQERSSSNLQRASHELDWNYILRRAYNSCPKMSFFGKKSKEDQDHNNQGVIGTSGKIDGARNYKYFIVMTII
jgi:hypothetical protein